MKKVLLTSALLLSFGSISSIQAAESVRWDSVSLSYQSTDLDDDVKLKGFGISGSKLINENMFVAGSYSSESDDIDLFGAKLDLDLNRLSLGLGYRHAISNKTDIFGILSYEDVESEASYQGFSEDASDNGHSLEAGIRSLVTENLELGASLNYIDIADESSSSVYVSAMYHFTDTFSAGVGYVINDEDTLSFSAVFSF